ncbi:MAG: hypothetical protein RJB58_1160 [Pseudomonadota bacterium]
MVMPAPTSPSSPYAQPPRRRNGCLWGCLIAVLLLVTPVLLAGGYGAWFLWDGYKRDPLLRLVGELVREDGMAQQVLGQGAVITGVDGNYFSWMPGRADNAYVVTLEGPKGRGQLAVSGHTGLGGAKIDSAILTGPDVRRYDLLKRQLLPDASGPVIDNSI